MGTEVSIPGIEGRHWTGGTQQHRGILQSTAVPGCGAERTAGSCTSVGEVAAEGIDFEADGCRQGADGAEVIHEIPVPSEEAILGQPLLGEGILRGYGGR